MWAEAGGIDFDGREKWDKWKECEGLSAEEAKFEFVRVRQLEINAYAVSCHIAGHMRMPMRMLLCNNISATHLPPPYTVICANAVTLSI